MRCGNRATAAGSLVTTVFLSQPGIACAHAFGQRYDLPAPLGYLVAGVVAAVALSFVVAAVFMRRAPRADLEPRFILPLGPLLPALKLPLRFLSVVLLRAVVVAGFIGSRNPEMNLAPILVWIVWWVGVAFLVLCTGNVWAALDPWRAIFEGLDTLARRLGATNGISLGRPYPRRVEMWPAVALLLLLCGSRSSTRGRLCPRISRGSRSPGRQSR